jgi:hypothetical protein
MTTQEIKSTPIGTKVSLMRKGIRVNGEVTGIFLDRAYNGEEIVGLVINHDPVQWGKDVYTRGVSMGQNLNTVKFI